MKRITLTQGSPEWLQYRKTKIGASEASIITGNNPWKKSIDLWREKLGFKEPGPINAAMQRGIDLEPEARRSFNTIMGFEFEPAVYESEQYPFLCASLDGICFYGYEQVMSLEIKLNGAVNHELACKGGIPKYYMDQLQHQMLVTELDSIYYYSYNGHSGKIIEVKRDQAYIDSLLIKLKEFWRCLQELEEPESEYVVREDEEWALAAKEYLNCLEWESRKEMARDRLSNLSGQSNCMGAGIRLSQIQKRGNVDYTKIPQIHDVDLEQYRKPPCSSYRITVV